ncbi:hypothetical protein CYMTET_6484 [Cymbomonas tetramitiformis]|uniref:Uncharacterized protein n=1 Tax=Cymbomonas tetramitiformis TaxID=36881 RepID=A0AAE0GXC3_9CHLO|nr:hypothetical protein CYMTET_6484 [Cymbomonas tetramitiformis]
MGSSNFGRNIWTILSILLLFASLGMAQYAGASFEEDTGEAMSIRASEKKPALRSKSVGPRKGLGKALVVDAQDAIDEVSSSEEIAEEASEELPAEEEEVAEVAEDAEVAEEASEELSAEEEEATEEAPVEESEEGLEESPVEEEVGEESAVQEEEEAADEEGGPH